ncbi:hypothetical protein IJ765_02045 [Candidatus Saccharibacteria bacterium]|nr:hypothetical protein [Candidatus Saccharibacteria bacterium]
MADYILVRKSRNIISSILHVIFNIILGVGSVILTCVSGSWVIGVLFVLVSKWRMFAVRPRYWFTNLKANLVDIIVGTSFVIIAYCSGTNILPIHIIVAVLYTLWLIILKPRSSELATKCQALAAVFLGTTALVPLFGSNDSIYLVIGSFILGYAASRHILIQSDDENFSLTTLVAGLCSAELAWLLHSWLIVYSFGNTGIMVPQLAIVLTIFSFLFSRICESVANHDGKLKSEDILIPAIFSLAVVCMIIFWFSKPIFDV